MLNPYFTSPKLDPAQRQKLVRTAKADTLAWQTAELLARGQAAEAAKLVPEAVALAGPERFADYTRHYAIMKFLVPRAVAQQFLNHVLPEGVAA
mgnify:CR=1 FL=1